MAAVTKPCLSCSMPYTEVIKTAYGRFFDGRHLMQLLNVIIQQLHYLSYYLAQP